MAARTLSSKRLYIFSGVSGSGKTWLRSKLEYGKFPHYGIDMADFHKEHPGMFYDDLFDLVTNNLLCMLEEHGGEAWIEGYFMPGSYSWRKIHAWCLTNGVEPCIIHTWVPKDTAVARINQREDTPAIRERLLGFIAKYWQPW